MNMKTTLNRLVALALAAVMAVSVLAVPAVSVSAEEMYNYQIKVKTGTKLGAGTDADVFLCAYNKNGNLITGDKILLDTDGNSFENGDTDTFNLTLPEKIESIKIGTKDPGDSFVESIFGSNDEWYLENIEITFNNSETKTYNFDKWIKPGHYGYYDTRITSSGKKEKVYVCPVIYLYTPDSIVG